MAQDDRLGQWVHIIRRDQAYFAGYHICIRRDQTGSTELVNVWNENVWYTLLFYEDYGKAEDAYAPYFPAEWSVEQVLKQQEAP